MPARSRLYFLVVVAGAAALLLSLPWADLYNFGQRELIGLAILILIGILAEALSFSYQVGSNIATSSVTFVPILAAAVLFPPIASVACAVAVMVVTEAAVIRKAPWKVLFNSSQVTLSTAAAAWIIFALSRDLGSSLLAFLVGAFTFFVLNQVCVAGFLALAQDKPLLGTLRQMMGGSGSNLFFDVIVSPIALVVAMFYNDYGPGGLFVIALPLLLVRHAYLSKIQVQKANNDILRVLIKAIETRDPYTSGHSMRVSVLARAVAEDLGLAHGRVEAIETAALLHDIGKIDGIYAPLISKPHSLSSEERTIIRTHATKGADYLQGLSSFSSEIIDGVRHHHERFDGNGYPDGLVGKDIPVAARIIMMCDAMDAMLSDRPYRKALPIPTVERELQACSGDQFDPDIVDVVIRRATLARAAELVREHPTGEVGNGTAADAPAETPRLATA